MSIPPLRGECQTYVASLDGKEKKPVLSSSQGAVFAPPNFLVFTRGRTVLAQRFDPGARRLSGEPTAIAELRDVSANLGEPCASTSRAGALSIWTPLRPGPDWYGLIARATSRTPSRCRPDRTVWSALSPDGRQATIDRQNTPASQDILIIDLVRSTLTQLVTEPGYSRGPVWDPAMGRKCFTPPTETGRTISSRDRPRGMGPKRWCSSRTSCSRQPMTSHPTDATSFSTNTSPQPATGYLAPAASRRPEASSMARTPSNENNAAVSPDGRWVTYLSNESGQFEIYVAPFAGGGSRVQVSRGGGGGNTWRSDGKEIIYSGANGIMAAEVRAGDQIDVGEPHALFKPPPGTTGWAPTPDGRRFLLGLPVDTEVPRTPTIVLNWTAGLERRH